MNGRSITIKIDPMGNPKIEANNFAGVGCEAATKPIEQALGAGNGGVTRELKGEYYASEGPQQEQQHQSW